MLRHEEFEEGCAATCNGPYNGKWSKTMVGYGPEDDHFVVELTYNYGIDKYKLGNDFQGILVKSSETLARAKENGYELTEEPNGFKQLLAPDGYPFAVEDQPQPDAKAEDPVKGVSIGVSSLQKSLAFWRDQLGMKEESEDEKEAVLRFGDGQAALKLIEVGKVDHGTAFGRVAFAVPAAQLPAIEERMKAGGNKILTPLVKLDTPGKATVEVVILADPVRLRAFDLCLHIP